LELSVRKHPADAVLFSGGLDSAIVLYLNPCAAVNVKFEDFGEDSEYADFISRDLNINIVRRIVDREEALEAVPEVIKVLKSFDPAIPNDLAAYFGLIEAKKLGYEKILTGDASDELFGGYSYMRDMEDLEGYIRRLSENMVFNSNRLGEELEMKILQPYIGLSEFACSIPTDLKIRKENEELFGKWILRKAFEDIIPGEIIWQSKRPLEYGSGMTGLRDIIESMVPDEEYNEAVKTCQVSFISKEHYYYYKIYMGVVGEIPKPGEEEISCPGCGAGMRKKKSHCWVCGWVRS
jgi:asparagine synthase (glutamine-hydrolysing)